MSRFGPDPRAFFQNVYLDVAPWDVGSAQPAMAALIEEFPPEGPVLDVGCGSGDLAIHLARLGHRVVGVDFIDAAIVEAEKRAAALPAEVAARLSFRIASATRPSALDEPFTTIVDSGFLHLLDQLESDRFIDDVSCALPSGGRYYLHEFAIEYPIDNVPRAVTEDELRTRFTAERGWRILDIRPAEFLSRVAPPTPGIAACVERL